MTAGRVVVLACGNRSRGDDALGPLLLDRIAAMRLPHVVPIEDYQLNIEHALDIEGADAVLFIDAGTGTTGPFTFAEAVASEGLAHSTHAIEPAAVLATYRKITGVEPPPAFVLCVRGDCFDLGAGLSAHASANLEQAWAAVLRLLAQAEPSSIRAGAFELLGEAADSDHDGAGAPDRRRVEPAFPPPLVE